MQMIVKVDVFLLQISRKKIMGTSVGLGKIKELFYEIPVCPVLKTEQTVVFPESPMVL